jgi:pyruvate dehydrogenase E2 component (dihydrolipoamide acetyltransferase)
MARAVARDKGIDLSRVTGSGPGGRIIREDVEAFVRGDGGVAAPPAAAPPAAAPAAVAAPAAAAEELPVSSMRKIVAKRLVESMQSAPHFFLTVSVDAEELVAFRGQLNQRLAAAGQEAKLSVNDLLVKACATALLLHPEMNVSWGEDKILKHNQVHVGVAVAIEAGLIVPVIRDADRKSVTQISTDAKALIAKARAGKLTPAEFQGGTFTISNLGMFGIEHFTAIINPPEAAILAVGATTPQPVVRDGEVVVRQVMKLTLSIDHRPIDGATGAQFLQTLKAILEEPLRIVA